MAIKLKCPACSDTVFGQESDRGTSIKCGTCWADVPVPKAEPLAAPVAKPLPPAAPAAGGVRVAQPLPANPAKPPVAIALPLGGAPAAKPVTPAQPAPLNPIDARNRSRDDEERRPREKRRFQDRDDDDDDDRPTRSNRDSGGGGKGLLLVLLGVGLLMTAGLGVALYFLFSGGEATSPSVGGSDVAKTNPGGNNPVVQPNLGGDPGRLRGDFNPNPQVNRPNANQNQPGGWAEFRGNGFAVSAPGKMTKSPITFAYHGKFFQGDKYEAKDSDDIEVIAQELDSHKEVSVNTVEFVSAATFNLKEKIKKTAPRPMPSGLAHEYTTTEISGNPGAVLVGSHAGKVYVFHVRWKQGSADGPKRRDEFFNSVRILSAEQDPNGVAGGPPNIQPKLPPGVRNPFDRQPNGPQRIVTPWKPVDNKSGFTADAPPGVAKEKQVLELEGNIHLSGMKYTVDDGQVAYWMFHHDLAPGQDIDLQKIAGKLIENVFPHKIHNSEDAKLDGKAATKWTIRHFHGGLSAGYTVKIGYRVFTFFVTSKQGIYGANGDPTLDERQKKFLESIKLTFDPATHNPYADEPEWVSMAKTVGFTVNIPRQATTESEFRPFFEFDAPIGKTYKAEVDGIVYEATVINLTAKKPAQPRATPPDFSYARVIKSFTDREQLLSGPDKAKLSGNPAEQYIFQTVGSRSSFLRATTAGKVVYVLKTSHGRDWNKKSGDKEFTDKSTKFFDSFRIGTVGANDTGGASGEFVSIADGKVKPFWTAIFLADKKELITFGVRDLNANPPGGVVRRYSTTDLKLKATYHLPYPVHRAAVDEKSGKLYAASVTLPADARMPEREAAIVSGVVQMFDLKKLTDGTLGELDEVKPTTTFSTGARISGLDVSPSGDAVFVSCVTQGGTKQKPFFAGKLIKIDPNAEKPTSAELPCSSPVWAMRASLDGRRLAVIERATDPLGNPTGGGNLVLVDTVNWKRQKSASLASIPWDVTMIGDRAAALESLNGTSKITVMKPDGDTSEVSLEGDLRYVRATPDGKKLLVSAGAPVNGVTLYDVAVGKPLRVTKKATGLDVGTITLGGLVNVSPDSKLAVTNTGAVLDLTKTVGK